MAGYGLPDPHHRALLEGLQPWRTLAVATTIGGVEVFAASYHAPPGVSYGIAKPRQAVAFASWLEGHRGPALFGADANTPLVDAVDFAAMRTHWHTGDRRLNGEPGDDLLFGPGKKHALDDALRRWLAEHPDEMAALAVNGPQGPLAVTHRTGRRKTPTEPGGALIRSGSAATGPCGTSSTSTTAASPLAAINPSLSRTLISRPDPDCDDRLRPSRKR